MRSRELTRQLQRIEALIDRVNDATNTQLELHSHWGRYLCILVAGFVENAYGTVYSEYVRLGAGAQVARHTTAGLLRVRNPNAQKFIETSLSFNAGWGSDLENHLLDNGLKEALDGIMAVRHEIAHGRDTGITVARVRDYLARCVQAIEFIEGQCGLANPY